MSRRRVLVTGATGFLGGHITRALARAGWEVRALVHLTPLPAFEGNVTPVHGDLLDVATANACVIDVDAVCHAAALIPSNFADPSVAARCLEVNAIATLNIASASAVAGARFIYLSSGQGYEYSPHPVSETDNYFPSARAAYYLASKLTAEVYVEHLRGAHNLNGLILRVGSCYGLGMPEKAVVARFMQAAREGLPLTIRNGGKPTYDFIHADDVAALVQRALDDSRGGIYNAGSGVATTVLNLARQVADTFPERDIQIVDAVVEGPEEASFPALSMEKAERDFGHVPLALRDGLVRYRKYREEFDAIPASPERIK